MTTTLTKPEAKALEACEDTIRIGKETFVEVGLALTKIRDERLYRGEFGSFNEYCETRWGWTGSRARQLIGAADVANSVTIVTLPNEASARELSKVEPSKRAEVVKKAAATGKVTAKSIAKAAEPEPELEPEEEKPRIQTRDQEFKQAAGFARNQTPLGLELLEDIEVEIQNMRLLQDMVREGECDCGVAKEIRLHQQDMGQRLRQWLKEKGCQP